jgi:hypothetical protein
VSELVTRLERLEATEQIRQLVARYALALDSRDIPSLVSLFIEDVVVGRGRVGRAELAAWFDPLLRPYRTTFHFIGNHVIKFEDDDHASGVVYCRPEHEVGDEWIVMPMNYRDSYVRRDGCWLFQSRRVEAFYAADVTKSPTEAPGRFHFPGNPLVHEASLPERWPSWAAFWGEDR